MEKVNHKKRLPEASLLVLITTAFIPLTLQASLPATKRFQTATVDDYEMFAEACQPSLPYAEADETIATPRTLIYRTASICTEDNFCNTYFVDKELGRCIYVEATRGDAGYLDHVWECCTEIPFNELEGVGYDFYLGGASMIFFEDIAGQRYFDDDRDETAEIVLQ